MKTLILGFLITLGFYTTDKTYTEYDPIAVLELFTSQGCSSCPSADNLLDRINKDYDDKNVFALSYHVSYWNYIGWKDPFSDPKHTNKQNAYARKFRSRSIYTPQLVINGKEHFVGSNETAMYSKVKEHLKIKTSNQIEIIKTSRNSNNVNISFKINGNTDARQTQVILVLKGRQTQVKRGENRNRTLKNSNIVVSEKFVPTSNQLAEISLDIPTYVGNEEKLQVIVLTKHDDLSITGASKSTYF
ncbi:DUF1223 domain-containing protein [Tenacibaculum xiamenense]|uniref:DUF1223 domain-containing protein n=1 Tax=Tenacibaculum xiamenense TaxID=1261553 RepID=UPI00389661A6